MSDEPFDPPEAEPNPPKKSRVIRARIDDDLAEAAERKARRYGWSLSAVMRALLELWVQEDVISSEDVGRAATPAPKPKRSDPDDDGGE